MAWVEMWCGRYSDKYGRYIPLVFKQQGYIFCDRERLLNETIWSRFRCHLRENQVAFIL